MKQQINLYQPIFRKQQKVFTAVAMFQVFVLVLIMITGLNVYSYYQIQRLEMQLADAKKSTAKITADITKIRANSNPVSKLLEQEIKRLTLQIEERRKISDFMSRGSFSNTSGFSSFFEALARQHVKGSWLTSIRLSNGGNSSELTGVTIAPELVPKYLQRLMQEKVFSTVSFNVLDMQRSEINPNHILFYVGTEASSDPVNRFKENLYKKIKTKRNVIRNESRNYTFAKNIVDNYMTEISQDNITESNAASY